MRQPHTNCFVCTEMTLQAVVAVTLILCATENAVIAADGADGEARYTVRMLASSPPRFEVTASLPVEGDALAMYTSRPGGIAELDARGWTALVRRLEVRDASGSIVPVQGVGAKGWRLRAARSGRLMIQYEVDYSLLAERDWPAQREAAIANDQHFVFLGGSMFITTSATRATQVTFQLPRPWRAITPWAGRSQNEFVLASAEDLVTNLVALSRSKPDVVEAHGFVVQVVRFGQWNEAASEVRRVVRAVVPRLLDRIGSDVEGTFLIVLMPERTRAGEAFRNSLAVTFGSAPGRANSADWGNTIAHEIFHYWNGSRLRGADYAATQWFQEGFTEYAANLAMAESRLIDEDALRNRLARHVENYAKLATPLAEPGNRKAPPLYSGGALVAFSWHDPRIDSRSTQHP